MFDTSIHRSKQREHQSDPASAVLGRVLLLFAMAMGISSCASPESIDMSSYDPSHNQAVITNYYRNQAMVMREKASAQTTAAVRYEGLFGPEADLVSGARLLAVYYEQTAKELDRLAEAHAAVARTGRRPTTVP